MVTLTERGALDESTEASVELKIAPSAVEMLWIVTLP
jgi:hypothetical protein